MLRYLEFFWIITPPCVFFDVTEIYMMKLLYAHVRVVVFFSVRETRQLVPNTAAGCLGSITRPRNRLVPRLRLLPFVVFLIYHIFTGLSYHGRAFNSGNPTVKFIQLSIREYKGNRIHSLNNQSFNI